MYHKVEQSGGIVRVVESHTDELKGAAFYGIGGLLFLRIALTPLLGPQPPTGFLYWLAMAGTFLGVFMVWIGFTQGFGRLMRGWVRGLVIEVDLPNQRFRRFRRRLIFKKEGGEWQPMGGAPQGAKVQGSAKTRLAIRVGGERDFVYPTEPGELEDDALYAFIETINRQLAAMGVTSREIAATQEPRPLPWRLRFRKAWELASAPFLIFLAVAFIFGYFLAFELLVSPPSNPS